MAVANLVPDFINTLNQYFHFATKRTYFFLSRLQNKIPGSLKSIHTSSDAKPDTKIPAKTNNSCTEI